MWEDKRKRVQREHDMKTLWSSDNEKSWVYEDIEYIYISDTFSSSSNVFTISDPNVVA